MKAYPKTKPSGVEWLSEVPEHWGVKRLKMAAVLTDKKVEPDEENPVPYVGLEHIESWTGRLLPIDPDLVPTGIANAFEAGSVLFGKLRPYLAKSCTPEFSGLCSTELLVLQGCDLDRHSLRYTLLSEGFIDLVDSSTYGSKMPRANWSFIGDCLVPVPSPEEQTAIAAYLDRETGRIDELVGKKRDLIERLKEKRTALISRTVTRGLPANLPSATLAKLEALAGQKFPLNPPLKPSGIDWLGEVPEHWHVLPFTKYVADKSDYRGKTPEKQPDGVFLVTARNVRMGFIDYESSQEFIAKEDYDEVMRRGLPKQGDILFTTEAPLGNVALVDREDIALAQRIIRFRMAPTHYVSKFVLFAMMSDHFQIQLKALSSGSTAEGVKASKLHILRLIAPPIPEQRAIAAYLDEETAKLDALVAKVETAIERLQEYRTALITAAVTGKFDVTAKINP